MKTFRSLEDVEAANLSPPVHGVVRSVVKNLIDAYAEYGETYDAESDGYTVLVEEGDTDAELEAEVGYNLREAVLEGGYREGGVFCTCVLHNNQYGVSFLVPDAPWLDRVVRAKLEAECGEGASP